MHPIELTYDEALYRSKFLSPAGLVLVVLRAAIGYVFIHSVCHTIHKYGAKRGFYRKFLFFGAAWILTYPLVLMVCGFIMVFDTKNTVFLHVEGVLLLFNLAPLIIFQIGMLLMYDPTCK